MSEITLSNVFLLIGAALVVVGVFGLCPGGGV
jgi:hypothetical protein